MKKIWIFSLLVLVTASVFGRGEDRERLRKSISKAYYVRKTEVVKVVNKYGKITVDHWNLDKLQIDVEIIAEAGSKAASQELMDRIQVSVQALPGVISAVTTIRKKSWSFSLWGNNENMEINYHIRVPFDVALQIENQYGDVYLPDYTAPVQLNVSYGNLIAQSLSNNVAMDVKYGDVKAKSLSTATINLAYTDIEVSNCGTCKVDIQYGNLDIEQSNQLTLKSQYCELDFGNIQTFSGNGAYNNYNFKSLNTGTIQDEYGEVKIGYLGKALSVAAPYTTSIINEIAPNTVMSFSGDYSTTEINTTKPYSYALSGAYSSAEIGGEEVDTKDNGSLNTQGRRNGSGSAQLAVKGNYMNVVLK